MTEITVIEREHAEVSPSGFERIEQCTMSARLAATAPRSATGPDALAGTAAHAVLERCLSEGLDTIEIYDLDHVTVEGQQVPVDNEMLNGVQLCLDYVRTSSLFGRPFEIEKTVHLDFAEQYLGKPMYGHADVIASPLPVAVLDYKNGFNKVEASAVQLGLYLLAEVLDLTGGTLEIEGTAGHTVVVQPNVDDGKISEHEWSFADLRELRDRVIDTLRKLRRREWNYAYGPWCRWCPAASLCPHLAATARDFALAQVAPSPEMVASGEWTSERLDQTYELIKVLDQFSKTFMATFEDYLVHGGTSQVAKLVPKRTNRRWIEADDAKVAATLKRLKIDPWNRKVVTPAEAERRLPEAKRPLIKDLTEKPIGELTVVDIDDKKPAIDMGAKLRAALEGSVAAGYLAASKARLVQPA